MKAEIIKLNIRLRPNNIYIYFFYQETVYTRQYRWSARSHPKT